MKGSYEDTVVKDREQEAKMFPQQPLISTNSDAKNNQLTQSKLSLLLSAFSLKEFRDTSQQPNSYDQKDLNDLKIKLIKSYFGLDNRHIRTPKQKAIRIFNFSLISALFLFLMYFALYHIFNFNEVSMDDEILSTNQDI